ncbi:hypothetical protein KJ974_05625 [bacterium]|nr:hypothetical protein [bacterium]MBU2598735.1 hypothetical protein [Actinomycetota bacterium]
MAYLMHIGFDNNDIFWKNIFYFEYKGIKFKFIQDKRKKWSNVLITIIKGQNNSVEENRVYSIASEYLSALAWENNSVMKVWPSRNYGAGISEDIKISKARRVFFEFPKSPFYGYTCGCDFQRIPKIENEKQRDAFILYREARSTNNDFLSFLFFWQVLEIGYKGGPTNWINKIWRNNQGELRNSIKYDIGKISMGSKKIGEYLYHDCRTAIAHLYTLRNGIKKIKIDSLDDAIRIMRGRRIIQEFARLYIKNELNLRKRLYLVRKSKNGFPVYLDEKYYNKIVDNNFYREAYKYKSNLNIKSKNFLESSDY